MAMNKILVVDDDLDILEVLKFLLRKNGYEVVLLSEAQRVIETTKEAQPDIILLDINLSGYDGREICKYLKTTLKLKTPVILFSANVSYKSSYKEYYADDFLEKPFEVKKLLSILRSHLPVKA
ncbi:response regulator [Ilyomonas limi]|uniref:Response regulator n=2 Tax=Ilyomonas limi TaxID=2575867 RepID=A0A4V5UX95_9BACT|nr:response regulator [Ilyomonas limi]